MMLNLLLSTTSSSNSWFHQLTPNNRNICRNMNDYPLSFTRPYHSQNRLYCSAKESKQKQGNKPIVPLRLNGDSENCKFFSRIKSSRNKPLRSANNNNLINHSVCTCSVDINDVASVNQDAVIVAPSFPPLYNHYQPPMELTSSHKQNIMQQQCEKHHSFDQNNDGQQQQQQQQQDVPVNKQRRRQLFGNCLNLARNIRGKKNAQKVSDSNQINNNKKQRVSDNSGFIDQLKTSLEAKIFLTKMYIRRRFRSNRTTNNSMFSTRYFSNSSDSQVDAHSSQRTCTLPTSSSASGNLTSSANYPTANSKPRDRPIPNIELGSSSAHLVGAPSHNHYGHHHNQQQQQDSTHQDQQQQQQPDRTSGSSSQAAASGVAGSIPEFPARNSSYFTSLFNSNHREAFGYKQRTLLMEKLNLLLVRMLSNDGQMDMESARSIEEACAICFCAKVDVQTFPCKHCAVCFYCFIRTIYVALQENQYPLKCVICRSKVERIKATFYGRSNDNKT